MKCACLTNETWPDSPWDQKTQNVLRARHSFRGAPPSVTVQCSDLAGSQTSPDRALQSARISWHSFRHTWCCFWWGFWACPYWYCQVRASRTWCHERDQLPSRRSVLFLLYARQQHLRTDCWQGTQAGTAWPPWRMWRGSRKVSPSNRTGETLLGEKRVESGRVTGDWRTLVGQHSTINLLKRGMKRKTKVLWYFTK